MVHLSPTVRFVRLVDHGRSGCVWLIGGSGYEVVTSQTSPTHGADNNKPHYEDRTQL